MHIVSLSKANIVSDQQENIFVISSLKQTTQLKQLTVNSHQVSSLGKANPFQKNRADTHLLNTHAMEQSTLGKNVLLGLLHKAIAANQTYPEQAQFLNICGTVKLAFVLEPSGEIENLHIVQTSGSTLLDDEAMKTINQIIPFKQAKNYLHTASLFSLDITYA